MVITWKTRSIRSLNPLKIKTITIRVLSINEVVLVVHVTLVKHNEIPKLDRMNIIVQLDIENH